MREFCEESYGLLSELSDKDLLEAVHMASQKCILSMIKIDTINEYYSFELVKSLAETRYLENMKSKRSDQWETLTFERFSLNEFEKLIFGSKVGDYDLWNLDRVMLAQKWNEVFALLTKHFETGE